MLSPPPFKDNSLDAILLDAPCSSTGTIKKNPDIKWIQSPDELLKDIPKQKALLHALAPKVAKEGYLVYSTCSIEPEENQEQILHFLAFHPEFKIIPFAQMKNFKESYSQFLTKEGFFQLTPSETFMGFFAAILKKGKSGTN